MKQTRRSFLAAAAAFPMAAYGEPPFGSVQRLSPRLDALIAPDAEVERLGGGLQWAEGPVWVKDGSYLLFSDPPKNMMYRWSQAEGVVPFMHPSGYAGADTAALREAGSNGLAIDASGALVMCDSGSRALARMDLKTKQKVFLTERFEGKRFNSPNDLCIARSGAIYFTDPPYGLAGLEKSPVRELPFSGVYRWTPDGKVALIENEFLYPNGVALSPDESTFYVSNTDANLPIIRAYTLGSDGLPTGSSTFFDVSPLIIPGVPGMPDGIKVDVSGNLFAAGPGGILVLSKESELLGIISAGRRAMPNCAFGEDGRSLFLAATDCLARIRLNTRGA